MNQPTAPDPTLREALQEAIEWATRPRPEWAYRRCSICEYAWWGHHPDHPKRGSPERERHSPDCLVLRWRAALALVPVAPRRAPFDMERAAEAVHQAYLDTCERLGWGVKPENQVSYAELSEDSKELDRASVRAVLDLLAAPSAPETREPERPSCPHLNRVAAAETPDDVWCNDCGEPIRKREPVPFDGASLEWKHPEREAPRPSPLDPYYTDQELRDLAALDAQVDLRGWWKVATEIKRLAHNAGLPMDTGGKTAGEQLVDFVAAALLPEGEPSRCTVCADSPLPCLQSHAGRTLSAPAEPVASLVERREDPLDTFRALWLDESVRKKFNAAFRAEVEAAFVALTRAAEREREVATFARDLWAFLRKGSDGDGLSSDLRERLRTLATASPVESEER